MFNFFEALFGKWDDLSSVKPATNHDDYPHVPKEAGGKKYSDLVEKIVGGADEGVRTELSDFLLKYRDYILGMREKGISVFVSSLERQAILELLETVGKQVTVIDMATMNPERLDEALSMGGYNTPVVVDRFDDDILLQVDPGGLIETVLEGVCQDRGIKLFLIGNGGIQNVRDGSLSTIPVTTPLYLKEQEALARKKND
ncbi:MAG: hypothetical protein ABID04_01195 [Patescibacteria group bacterium]